LPNKLFEYIIAGIPVLVSALYNMETIVNKWRVGEIIKTESLEDCKNLILNIYKNRKNYQENISLASKKLHWDVQHRRFIGLFHE